LGGNSCEMAFPMNNKDAVKIESDT